ncbi:MAG: type II toxin-antitoxin system VapC family toxin [Myxococcales bacterium]|nr:type II toxin-antitoxin system VapC family toxin [Myxococcales bacterium]
MSFLLDTCVVSEFTKRRADPRVIEWIALHDESALFLSEVTVGELEKGLSKLPDGARQKRLRAFIEVEIFERFHERILPVDLRTWRRWGAMTGSREREGKPLPVLDALLASTAWLHGLSLVTRNERDFTDLGVRLVNPWGSAA